MEFVGSMNDLSTHPRGMDIHPHEDSRRGWLSVRDFYKSSDGPNSDSGIWRVSWLARCTWIPAINKAAGRKRGRGPRKMKKHHIVNFLATVYLSTLSISAVVTIVLWVK